MSFTWNNVKLAYLFTQTIHVHLRLENYKIKFGSYIPPVFYYQTLRLSLTMLTLTKTIMIYKSFGF